MLQRGSYTPKLQNDGCPYNSYQNHYEHDLISNSVSNSTQLKMWIKTIDVLNVLKINKASDEVMFMYLLLISNIFWIYWKYVLNVGSEQFFLE